MIGKSKYVSVLAAQEVMTLNSPAAMRWAMECIMARRPIFRRGTHWMVVRAQTSVSGLQVHLIEIRLLARPGL